MMTTKRFWIRAVLHHGGVISHEANSVAEADGWARRMNMREWEIFRAQPGFHSTVQREHLARHHESSFWIAQGVPSDQDLEAAA